MDALGRFRLRRELGSGQFATVYEAHDGQQPCALKILDDGAVGDSPSERAGITEALAGLTALQHPSIVRVLDGGEEDGRLFVSMELMPCPTLEQKLAEQGSLDEGKAVLFVRQIAQALDRARDLGYFHGNLVLRNVFAVSDEKVKVTDFGVQSFILDPPEAGEYSHDEAADAEDVGSEWVTAQELLSAKGTVGTDKMLDEDFLGLACMMLSMLGVSVPSRIEDESAEDYRERLRSTAYDELTERNVSRQTSEVVRRLLTAGEFASPGELVVELASAMLLRRSSDRVPREDTQMRIESEGLELEAEEEEEEIVVEPVAEDILEGDVPEGLEPIQFQGDPRNAAYTPFFAWDNRRSGKFFVIYEGEQLAIGRDPEVADITLMDPAVSRKHCIISKEGGVIRVEDLGSSNGTFMNEKKITTAEVLPDSCVRIGATRVFMSLAARI